ncbi:MAG: hypothetical protein ACI84K_000098 [Pseudohongiellaceae bacterium]|jgi:hypothetical protein
MMNNSKPCLNESFASSSKIAKYEKWQILLNALLFQCLWFSIMVFDKFALVFFLGALLGQFFYQWYFSKAVITFILPFAVFVLGVCLDISLTAVGLFSFPSNELNPGIADIRLFSIPVWLIGMWLGFVLTLQNSLQWVRARKYVCVLVFAIFGPVSYIAGRQFGMIQFGDEVSFYLIVAWAFVGWVASFKITKI